MTEDSSDHSRNEFWAEQPGTPARSLIESEIEALRGQGGVFVEAVRATRMPMAVTDPLLPGNPIVFVNQALIELSGYTMDEILGQQPHFMTGKGTNAADAGKFREILARDQDEVIESVQYRKDGSRFVAAVLLSAFKDNEGRTLNQFLSYLDITRRVAAEEQLESSRRAEALSRASELRLLALEERQSFLLALSDALRSIDDPLEMEEHAAAVLGDHLRVDRSLYCEVDERAVWANCAQDFHAPGMRSFTGSHRLNDWGEGVADALRRGRVIAIDDIEGRADLAAGQSFATDDTRAIVAVPLIKQGRLVAIMIVHQHRPRVWAALEIETVEEAAERTWSAVERARAEQALRESEQRLASVLEQVPIGVGLFDAAGMFTLRNPSIAAMIGDWVPSRDTETGHLWEGHDATGQPIAREDYPGARALRGEETILPVDFRRRDLGVDRWMRVSAVPVRENDKVTGGITVVQDVTDERRVQEEIRALAARNAEILESISDAFYAVDREWRFTYVNRKAEEWWGRPRAALLGQIYWQEFPDAVGSDSYLAHLRAAELREVVRLETVSPTLGNWVELSIYPTADGGLSVYFRDVSARKHAEERLRDSEERFRTLAESIEDVFYMTDLRAGALQYLSPSYERVWGRSAAALMTDLSHHGDTIHPDDRARVAEGKATQERGEPVAIEYRIVRPDGEIRWIFDRCFPVPGAEGRRSAGVASDVTARKQAEAARAQQEERLQLVVEGTHDYAIFTADAEGRVVDWYAGAEAVYGFSAEEIVGQDIAVLYTPEDRAVGVPGNELREARATGSAPNVRWHVRKGGGRVFIEGYAVRLQDSAGQLFGYLKIGQDVTERRRNEERMQESERRFRTLAEGIPQLVWRSVDHGEWSWASPQWTAFTGQSDAASLGQGWLDVVHPDDRDAARGAWKIATAAGYFDGEYRIREAASGAYRFFQSRATPVHDEDGELVEWLGTSTDVEDLRELQDRQEVLVAELQHRTRNVIAVIRSMADKTMRGADDLTDFRAKFRDRLDALARVQGLLSRLEEHDRVTFDELIRTELAALGALDGAAARVTLDGPDGVRLRSTTVQTLALALHELATNAVKYGALGPSEGQLRIAWALEPIGEDGDPWLRIDWRESGVAMPAPGAAPTGTGQGRELIERALPYQLKAKTRYELGTDGVRCTISIPISASLDRGRHGR